MTPDRRQTVGTDWTRRRQNSHPCPRPNSERETAHLPTWGASTYHRIQWHEEDETNLNTANWNLPGEKSGGNANAANLEVSHWNTLNVVRGESSLPAEPATASAVDPGTQESPRCCTGGVELKIVSIVSNNSVDELTTRCPISRGAIA